IEGADREIARLEDFVSEGESVTAGTDEELRDARTEEERTRIASTDAAATEASIRERVAALQASLEAIAAERDRTRTALAALPAELASLRERREQVEREALEAARRARESAEAAAERSGAARNDLQRIDGDLALVRGQTTALREAAERATGELAARDAGAAAPSLPAGFAWLHERITVPREVAAALGDHVAVA